jgi:hypothetical protein
MDPESNSLPKVTAARVSVGSSTAPVLHVLRQHRPAHVWYFCSAGSRAKADEIQRQLDWHPQARFIEVGRFEELGPCYRELRRVLPKVLAETKVAPGEVLVDYTGGTKTISAALVLAASELFDQFSYVGGEQREKGGLGIVVDGKERVHYQGNPWSDLSCCQPDPSGEIRLSLGECFRALAALGHERAREVVADIDAVDSAGKTTSLCRAATEKRNASILAQGVKPIGADGFAQMKRIGANFLGFDLAREANPVPPLNLRWF